MTLKPIQRFPLVDESRRKQGVRNDKPTLMIWGNNTRCFSVPGNEGDFVFSHFIFQDFFRVNAFRNRYMGNIFTKGQKASTESLAAPAYLPSLQIYTLSKEFGLSVAQLEYCHRRYQQLRHSPQSAQQSDYDIGIFLASAEGNFSEHLKLDWLLSRVFYGLFPDQTLETVTFRTFLEKLSWWRRSNPQKKLQCKLLLLR